jgi:tetratricopeptide (TPR) repeat protein
VHASGRTKFSQDYKKISEVLGLSVQGSDANEEEILGNVKDWFESTASGEWLLFLDNADDISDFARNNSDISGSIPQGSKGTVIITTRSRQVASRLNCEAIAITAMNVEEATQLFSRRYGQHKSSHDLEAVSKLLESLDYLPLAVIGATSFMVEMDTSPSEYLELLNSTKQTQQDLLLTEFNDVHSKVLQNSGSDVTENVLDTYYITFKQIDRQLPLAADFLRLIAFLDPQGIPEELLAASELGDVSNKVLFRKAIGKLVDFSLVTRAEGGAMFTLHRLVHLSMITYLSLQEREEWRAKALKLVSRVFPEDPKYENRHICAIYLPHALAVTQNCDAPISASLLQCIARHLRQKGDIKNAEIYCRRSFALREAADKNGFDTLSSVCDLASVLDDRGMYEQAAQLYKRALEGYENGLGLQHPNTLAVINNIASVLTKQGKYTLAEDMHRRALETREKVLGPDHPDTFHSVNNLARVLQDKGKYAQAELMFRRAVKGRGKVLGRDHPSTLTSLFNLAAVLAQQGKSKQAEMMYRCVLEEQRKVLGPDHPSTLTTLNNLAQVLRDQAKYEEAEQLNRQAVLGNEKTLGPDHPDTLTSVDNLATVLDHLGKYEESEQMNRRALEGYERALGPDHPKTLASVNNMAVTLHNEGKYKQAELMFRRALEGGEKVLGPDHPGTLTSIWCMAGLYERQRRFPEAKDLYARASRGFLKALGNEHPHTLECLEGLQRMLGKLKAS